MGSKLRIGMIGLGTIADNTHIPFYMNHTKEAELVAVCDADEKRMTDMCAKHGIEANAYTDYRELLKRDDLDAIDVCLHNNLHMPVTIAALQAGKHVYCEKPIAGCYVDGLAMMEAAADCGRMLHIQLATLYQPQTKVAKRLYDEQNLGEVYHVRSIGHRRRGRPFVDGYATREFVNKTFSAGGANFDMGVYHIAQLLYILNMPAVETISGRVYQKTDMYPHRRLESGYNVEEMSTGYVRFKGDLTMDVLETWAAHMGDMQGSTVYGSKAGLCLDPFKYFTTVNDLEIDADVDLKAWNYRMHNCFEGADDYDSSMLHWIAALKGRVDLLPTSRIALQTMLIQEGIYLSSKLAREVTAQEVIEGSKSSAMAL